MLTLIQAKQLLEGMDDWRGDCPDCGGKNTLSVSNIRGEIKWFCFKAHCKTKGRGDVRRTIDEILTSLRGGNHELIRPDFETPAHFTNINNNIRAQRFFRFLITIGMEKVVRTRYDPKMNRGVFIVTRNSKPVGAIGKALDKSLPKWYRYGTGGYSFIIGEGDTCVVVEDIPSACVAAAAGYSAMALLGTHLSTLDIQDLMGYNNIIVALDPDAHSKGIAMAARLSAYSNAKAILIPDDLKHFNPEEVRDILNG